MIGNDQDRFEMVKWFDGSYRMLTTNRETINHSTI